MTDDPDPCAAPMTETSDRTVADFLAEYLAMPPEAIERLGPEAIELSLTLMMACGMAQRAVESSPSKAYAPLLIERGGNPVLARGLASLAIRRGTRQAQESIRLPAVIGAIRFLAKPDRRRRAILRKAEVLLTAWEQTSIIETIFDDAGLSESEFIGLLRCVVEGREVATARLTEIAAAVAPRLSIARGPRISAASASHQLLLEEASAATGTQGYTWDAYEEDHSDPLTRATRREFDRPDFNPQPARRRCRRQAAIQGSRRKA
jgi:hypothetical protein